MTRDGHPRKGGAEGGGGFEQEERRATAAECTINIKSGQPFDRIEEVSVRRAAGSVADGNSGGAIGTGSTAGLSRREL